jgi:hypothetical protein
LSGAASDPVAQEIEFMAWETRGGKKYFYRSIRQDGRVKKIYYGRGPVGTFAANAEALRRAERAANEEAMRAERNRLDIALALTQELNRRCELLAAAALLAVGFHRPSRHTWRLWKHGRRILKCSP